MFNKKSFYYFEMEEKNVTAFINAVNEGVEKRFVKYKVGHNPDMSYAEGLNVWLVSFEASKKEFRNIMIELCKIGHVRIDESSSRYFVME